MQIQDCEEEKITMYRTLLKGLTNLLDEIASKSEKEALKFRITELGLNSKLFMAPCLSNNRNSEVIWEIDRPKPITLFDNRYLIEVLS
jgi:hypothetical protein